MRKRICIISFSTIAQDARVLRQVEYLSPHYDITLIGHGASPQTPNNVKYVSVPSFTSVTKALALVWLLLGRLIPYVYHIWYWSTQRHRDAYNAIVEAKPDAIHANDWSALPVAVEAAKKNGARIIFDAHEYAPLQFGNRRVRLLLYTPAIRYMLGKYAPHVDASITVCAPIAERYRQEYGLQPIVVMNAPKLSAMVLAERHTDPQRIRLIHHGGALRDRNLGVMIEALALADERFHLYFMLLPTDAAYLDELKTLAAARAPGRVSFIDPVPPAQIVPTLLDFDIGIYILKPYSYNSLVALPNKFFDFIAAGLAVVVGPSPAMIELMDEYGFGVASSSFEAHAVAATLNALQIEQISAMQRAARHAAGELNADNEMAKVVNLYASLLGVAVSSMKQDKAQ